MNVIDAELEAIVRLELFQYCYDESDAAGHERCSLGWLVQIGDPACIVRIVLDKHVCRFVGIKRTELNCCLSLHSNHNPFESAVHDLEPYLRPIIRPPTSLNPDCGGNLAAVGTEFAIARELGHWAVDDHLNRLSAQHPIPYHNQRNPVWLVQYH